MYSLFYFFFLYCLLFSLNKGVGSYDKVDTVHNEKVLEITKLEETCQESIHPSWLQLVEELPALPSRSPNKMNPKKMNNIPRTSSSSSSSSSLSSSYPPDTSLGKRDSDFCDDDDTCDDGKWSCSYCTYKSPEISEKCDICKNKRSSNKRK